MNLISLLHLIKTFLFFVIAIVASSRSFCQNKCDDFQNGIFYDYSENSSSESIYYRTSTTQKEVVTQTGDSTIWQIGWLQNCQYTLKLIKGNSYTEGQIKYLKAHIIFVKIVDVTDNYYTYESHLDKPTGQLI